MPADYDAISNTHELDKARRARFLHEVRAKRKKLADVLSDEDYSGIREIVEERCEPAPAFPFVKITKDGDTIFMALADLVELFFQAGGKVIVDILWQPILHQLRDGEACPGWNERSPLGDAVFSIENLLD